MKLSWFNKHIMAVEALVATGPCYNGSWMEVGLLVV